MSTITLHTTRANGTVLTAAIYNADHTNHVQNALNLNADKLEDANLGSSVIIGDMQDDIDALETGKADTVHTHPQSDVINLIPDLAAKAPLVSPALTGIPTAPTAAVATNTTQIATTAFVMANGGVGSSPPFLISDITGLQDALDDLAADIAASAPAVHTHVISDVTGLQAALDLKAPLASPALTGTPTAPTAAPGTNTTQVATTAFVTAGLATKANTSHTHAIADVTGLQTALDAKAPLVHTHAIADVTGLQTALDGKASTTHTHIIADVTGLQSALDSKAAAAHTHAQSDITNLVSDLALKAPLASPALTGTPTAPTASQGTSTTQVATTAFVTTGLATKASSSHTHAQSEITNLVSDLALKAPLASPALTGVPTAPTATAGTNTTQLATTAFVIANAAVPGPHTHVIADVTGLQAALDLKAPLASPALTGVPTAPTATAGTNTTQIATTAFVLANASAPGAHTHPISDITGLQAALDLKAPLASPALTGVPTAPTATAGTNTTQIATTAFVLANASTPGPHTHPISDITGLQAALDAKAPLASPALTGIPTAPTATQGDNSTQIATTAYVDTGLATKANTSHSHVIADVTGLVAALAGKADTTHSHAIADVTGLQSALDLKAPLASPALTGTPTAPTATAGTNTTQLATTAFVTAGLATKANSSHTHAQADITNLVSDLALKAPLASPALTGTPTAPTASPGTNTTQIATTAYVDAGLALKASSTHTHPQSDITNLVADLALKAPLASPTFTGTPAAPTAAPATSTTQLATTAFVTTADNLKANLASPTFTGTPAAPTATQGNNSTQIATTAYVDTGLATKAASSHTHAQSEITNLVADLALKAPLASPALTGTPTAPTAPVSTNTTQIATTAFVLANASGAPINSPAFTGTPTAPTAAVGTNTTQIATTAYVVAQGEGSTNPLMNGTAAPGTSTKFSKMDHVHPVDTSRAASSHTHAQADITNLVSDLALKAPLASPALTGTPTAPTASQGNNSTQLATTAYVDTGLATKAASTHSHAISDVTNLQTTLDAKETLGQFSSINSQTGTTYTLVLTDKGKIVELSNASAIVLTIPLNSSVAFPTNSYINLVQMGAGQVTITPAGGVTIRSRNGLKLAGQYAQACIYKRGTDEWCTGGDLAV